MIRSPSPDLALPPAHAPASPPVLAEAAEWLRLALGGWVPMGGGLALETLFDRLEGRA